MNNFVTGHHPCNIRQANEEVPEIEDWRVIFANINEYHYIEVVDLLPLLASREPITLPHEQICWRGQDDNFLCIKKQTKKYEDCDISFPGLVAESVPNPKDLPYRMIDGCHRMAKMKWEHPEITESPFLVISYAEFMANLRKTVLE